MSNIKRIVQIHFKRVRNPKAVEFPWHVWKATAYDANSAPLVHGLGRTQLEALKTILDFLEHTERILG